MKRGPMVIGALAGTSASVKGPAAWMRVRGKASSQAALLNCARRDGTAPPSVIRARVKARDACPATSRDPGRPCRLDPGPLATVRITSADPARDGIRARNAVLERPDTALSGPV